MRNQQNQQLNHSRGGQHTEVSPGHLSLQQVADVSAVGKALPGVAQPPAMSRRDALCDQGQLPLQGHDPQQHQPPALVPGRVGLGVLAQRSLRQPQLNPQCRLCRLSPVLALCAKTVWSAVNHVISKGCATEAGKPISAVTGAACIFEHFQKDECPSQM